MTTRGRNADSGLVPSQNHFIQLGSDGGVVADFLNARGDDGTGIVRVVEFKMHTPAEELKLEHGASPARAGDGDLDRLRAEFGMTGEKSLAASEEDCGVAVIHGLNFKNGGRREIVQEDAAFDLRPDDLAVDLVAQVWVRREHIGLPEALPANRKSSVEAGKLVAVYRRIGGGVLRNAQRGGHEGSGTSQESVSFGHRLRSRVHLSGGRQGMVAMEPFGPTRRAPPSG